MAADSGGKSELGAWPGLIHGLSETASARAAPNGCPGFLENLEHEMATARGRTSPFGPPIEVAAEQGRQITQVVSAYHRAVETIVRDYSNSATLRRVLRLPAALQQDVEADQADANGRVHLCRLDLLLDPDGGFKVIETNANCPGGLLSCGIASRRWRARLSEAGVELPDALPHETPNWMARWFLDVATAETGRQPEFVALFREDGGNRLEVPGLLTQLRDEGVEAIEADLRQLESGHDGIPTLLGRPVRHAYLKLGIQELSRMRPDVEVFVNAVLQQKLFVQNGIRGRCIGDNKLCLAVLSDAKFEHLFDPDDLRLLRNHIPWSRSAAVCSQDELQRVRVDPSGYVLKRPLDTKGRGVVIGREATRHRDWESALDRAVREGWLIQEFCTSTEILANFSGEKRNHHDLSVGAINGKVAGALSHSSAELRFNVARSGRLHPVFFATDRTPA